MMDGALFAAGAPRLDRAREVFASHCIPRLLEAIAETRWVPERTESNPFLTKIVIAVDPATDVELRVHIYRSKDKSVNVHDHRWPFYSMVVSGEIQHLRYAKGAHGFTQTKTETIIAGDIYYVGVDEFHTAIASDDTVTLLIRGPRQKDTWEMYNAAGELTREFASSKEHDQAALTAADVGAYLQAIPLRELGHDSTVR